MRLSSSGFGLGPGTIGTLGFMSTYGGKSSPEFNKLQGVQQTLQFAKPQGQNMSELVAYNMILGNMKPGDKDYGRIMAQRNELMFGFSGAGLQGYNMASQKNPKIRFAVGILNIVKRFLGIW